MFTLKAPAKINWFLSVLHKRKDGYHDILSLMQGITLYDHLTFEPSDNIDVVGYSAIPREENLVYKAAILLKERLSVRKGVTIILKKEIPVYAGLGGGSSDAASTLLGLNRLWNLGLNLEELAELGGKLGSDIPFFLNSPFAMVKGRGEIVDRLDARSPNIILLVKPDIKISTKWAYLEMSKLLLRQRADELTKDENNIKLLIQALDRQDFKVIASVMKNDLEVPVMKEFKIIGELKERMLELGAHAALMSGSGSAVFGVFENSGKAGRAAEVMKPHWCKVVETIITANRE
ncbi:MAG: 4-(cytidine 5'-diphospho)-2-C-methyl-D-erythritol kinase [Nitrospirae bacterium]|nr:4-(cytidine 5'-diphospho)-2-C-methyl-D-erythritol kinase [Nitrospirota bacterium]